MYEIKQIGIPCMKEGKDQIIAMDDWTTFSADKESIKTDPFLSTTVQGNLGLTFTTACFTFFSVFSGLLSFYKLIMAHASAR